MRSEASREVEDELFALEEFSGYYCLAVILGQDGSERGDFEALGLEEGFGDDSESFEG